MSERMTPVVTKVLPTEKDRFFEATERIGTTPSNAIRMFICAFNRARSLRHDPANAPIISGQLHAQHVA